ncbi:MAG: hypothetical protein JNM12_12425 [Alphaproteobacteria bacterium]|nr:hypothetical protein [Alphaproteobacteria bacterium]
MKLTRMFQSKADAFREAVRTDDLPRMEQLMQKKSYDFFFEILSGEYVADITPRMAMLLVEKLDDAVLGRWQMKDGSKQTVVDSMLGQSLYRNRLEIAELLMEKGGTNFNVKNGSWYLRMVIESSFAEDVKLRMMKQMLAKGYDKMADPDKSLQAAVDKKFTAAVDLFAAIGLDLHKNNEQLLRGAARDKSSDMALHLVTRHGADIDLAISTEMALGNAPVFEFLSDLKKQLPEKPAARTVESLTAEVGSLQDTVRELTEKLAKMQGEQTLDKPVLRNPAP